MLAWRYGVRVRVRVRAILIAKVNCQPFQAVGPQCEREEVCTLDFTLNTRLSKSKSSHPEMSKALLWLWIEMRCWRQRGIGWLKHLLTSVAILTFTLYKWKLVLLLQKGVDSFDFRLSRAKWSALFWTSWSPLLFYMVNPKWEITISKFGEKQRENLSAKHV